MKVEQNYPLVKSLNTLHVCIFKNLGVLTSFQHLRDTQLRSASVDHLQELSSYLQVTVFSQHD